MLGRRMLRPAVVVRPMGRPLLRGALVGGAAYAVGRHNANNAQAEAQQSQQISEMQAQQDQFLAQQQAEQNAAMQQQMQEQALAQARAQVAAEQQAAPAGGGSAMMSQLSQLAQMQAQGLLTADEFAAAKARLLGGH